MFTLDKNLIGILSLIFAVSSGVPYLYSVLKGKTKPHVFTWVIWTLLTAIAGAAQYQGHAGPGAWAAGLGCIFCILTTILSLSHGEKNITRSDWAAFLASLTIIPIWYMTSDPMIAAILATAIDALGYIPTFRKSFAKPQEEMIFSYVNSNLKHALSILAMANYSVTTLVYPAVLFFMNGALITILVLRRRN